MKMEQFILVDLQFGHLPIGQSNINILDNLFIIIFSSEHYYSSFH